MATVTLTFKNFVMVQSLDPQIVPFPAIMYTGSDNKEYVMYGYDGAEGTVNGSSVVMTDGIYAYAADNEDEWGEGTTFVPVVADSGSESEASSENGSPDDAYKNGDIVYIKLPEQYKAFVDRPAEFNDLYKAQIIDSNSMYAEAQIIYKDGTYGPRVPMYTMIGKTSVEKPLAVTAFNGYYINENNSYPFTDFTTSSNTIAEALQAEIEAAKENDFEVKFIATFEDNSKKEISLDECTITPDKNTVIEEAVTCQITYGGQSIELEISKTGGDPTK